MKRTIFALLAAMLLAPQSSFSKELDDYAAVRSSIPATATSPAGFLPANWKLLQRADGDLNGDGIADVALLMANGNPDFDNHRVLAVALKDRSGKLRMTDIGEGVVSSEPETFCNMSISIKKGKLITQSSFGSRVSEMSTLRFRYNPSRDGLQLIGQDIRECNNISMETSFDSTNYLTGDQLLIVERSTDSNGEKKVVSQKRSKVHWDEIFLGEICF
ncbi:MAG: hypothetical protein K2Z81_04560 [Cyanobacteria bacterium]|nr:hypothetical protein [Cyanobacteriota bacterium]